MTQVLARRWRPKTFSELVGQEHVVRALSNALAQQRLHHAYLLTGTRGVGKTTLARIVARALNCESGVTATPRPGPSCALATCHVVLAPSKARAADRDLRVNIPHRAFGRHFPALNRMIVITKRRAALGE